MYAPMKQLKDDGKKARQARQEPGSSLSSGGDSLHSEKRHREKKGYHQRPSKGGVNQYRDSTPTGPGRKRVYAEERDSDDEDAGEIYDMVMDEEQDEYKEDSEHPVGKASRKSHSSVTVKVSPSSMLKLCETINKLIEQKRIPELEHSNFTHMAINNMSLDNEECFDSEAKESIHALRHYYNVATMGPNTPFSIAVKRIQDFIESDASAIAEHPNFPPKPSLSASVVYGRKMRARGVKLGSSAMNAQMNADVNDPMVVEAINEFNAEFESYPDKIRKFMEKEKASIMPHQIPYLNRIIRKHEEKVSRAKRSVGAAEAKPSTRGRPKKKAVLTAFDVYEENMRNKYGHVSKEERAERLKRDFDVLTADQRSLLEMMATKK